MVLTCVRVSLAVLNSHMKFVWTFHFFKFTIIGIIVIIVVIVQVNALLETLDLTESAQRKGHFSLYNCLVLGHTKYNGVQRVYCNPFPAKPFYGSHRLELVMNHDSATGCRAWRLRGVARFSLVCTGFTPFLCHITNRHRVQNVWMCTRVNAGNIRRPWTW